MLMRLLVCLLLLTIVPSAAAFDFYQIRQWHHAGEYDKSFERLKSLAQMGYAPAQLELAKSYAAGYGTKTDFLRAYAWALMAKDSGAEQADGLYADYRSKIGSRRAGKKLYLHLSSQYGRKALEQQLFPKIHAMAQPLGRLPHPIETPEPQYPTRVYEDKSAFWVLMQFDINENGQTENVHALASYPNDAQVDIIRQTLQKWRFKPATDGDSIPQRFDAQIRLFSLYRQTGDYLGSPQQKSLMEAAQAGHADQQYLLSKLIESEIVGSQSGSATQWLLRSAVNGQLDAQLQLFQCLSYQSRCQADEKKAQKWLEMAREQDKARTDLLLAERLMSQNKQDDKTAHILSVAIKSNDLTALILYSRLLATSKDKQVNNPLAAIKYARQAMALDNNHPQLLATLAIAHFTLNKSTEAQNFLLEAIREAEYRRWPIDYYVNLLDQYQRATLLPQSKEEATEKAAIK